MAKKLNARGLKKKSDLCFGRRDLIGNEALSELDLGIVGDADDETILLHIRDCAINSTASNDLVASLQLAEHLIVGFLALALWRDDEKPHTHKKEYDGPWESVKATAAACALCQRKENRNFSNSHNA